MPMRMRFAMVPCLDLEGQQTFWCGALRGKLAGNEPYAMIDFPAGNGTSEQVLLMPAPPGHVAGAVLFWLQPTDGSLVDEVRRLEGLGALLIEKRHHGWGIGEVTMADPEGNAFIISSSLQEEREIPNLLDSKDWGDCDPFWEGSKTPYGRVDFVHVATI
ncbi:hypothetical protein ABH931_007422 [Streptacidiphilus sp. MAP12-33]|uniref:VOC family protein n=1 Tax=Streptacidiphilus sp. MAP12-33 TaxID=3156266 RepID=UPI003513976B